MRDHLSYQKQREFYLFVIKHSDESWLTLLALHIQVHIESEMTALKRAKSSNDVDRTPRMLTNSEIKQSS